MMSSKTEREESQEQKDKEESVKEYFHKYYQENKKRLNEANRRWALEHPDRVKEIKERSAIKNRAVSNQRRRLRIRLMREQLFEILGGKECTSCHKNDPRVLEFHHLDNLGYWDRKELFKEQSGWHSSFRFYSHYTKNPDEAKRKLSVLCANCNKIELCNYLEKKYGWKTR